MTATHDYPRVMSETELISRADTAALLGVSLQSVDTYARSGLLTRHRNVMTRRVRFELAEVEELRRRREETE